MKRKALIFIIALFIKLNVFSQNFHFINTHTSIIKSISQSPAHWYLEIYNDVGVDTTLRWKTTFVNIPPSWNINFDTQAGYFNPIYSGDSADFNLINGGAFPQKLIIGASTNNTPGHGYVFMDIYNPNSPLNIVTIEYEFIISGVPASIKEYDIENLFLIHTDYIESNLVEKINYSVVSENLQLIQSGEIRDNKIDISNLPSGIYFIFFQFKEREYCKKFCRLSFTK